MPKTILYLIPLFICCSTWATNINLSGTVVASPCTIDTDTISKVVEFQQGRSRNMQEAGSGGEWQDFQLLLTQCPLTTRKASVKFTGTVDPNDSTAFINTGTAHNVALRLADISHNVIYSNESTITANVISDRSITFPLSARMFTPLGNVEGGTFSSIVNVTFTYQ